MAAPSQSSMHCALAVQLKHSMFEGATPKSCSPVMSVQIIHELSLSNDKLEVGILKHGVYPISSS